MMSTPCGKVAGPLMSSAENLELPPQLRWTETDLNEKIISDGVEAKRFKVRAWGSVHTFQSGQENPGTQCDNKDDDIRQIDREECVVKDWRHTDLDAI